MLKKELFLSKPVLLVLIIFLAFYISPGQGVHAKLTLNNHAYFEKRGLNILVFSNWYDGNFSDAKIIGIGLIHHRVRTATDGWRKTFNKATAR